MRSTFIILFLLRTRLNKDGSATLMIRLTIEKDRLEISFKMNLDPNTWDSSQGKVSNETQVKISIS